MRLGIFCKALRLSFHACLWLCFVSDIALPQELNKAPDGQVHFSRALCQVPRGQG